MNKKNTKFLIAIILVIIGVVYLYYAGARSGGSDISREVKVGEAIVREYDALGDGMQVYEGIKYNPKLGAPLDEKIYIKYVENEMGDDAYNIKWFKTKISSSSPEYYIYQDDGPSGDPHFEFFIKNRDSFENVGTTPTGLKIPGDGFLYTRSRNNELFTATRKFKINDDGKVEEIPQALIYVNLATKVNKSINLYKKIYSKDVLITLEPGSMVTVVAFSEGDLISTFGSFLVRMSNDELGWVSVEGQLAEQCVYDDKTNTFHSSESFLQDICFAGD